MSGFVLVCVPFAADVEVGDGMSVRQSAVEPDIDPDEERNGNRGKKAHPKQAAGRGGIENSHDQGDKVHQNQQDDADDGNDLLGRYFFGRFVFAHGKCLAFVGLFLIIASHSRKVKVPGQGVTQVRGPYKRGGLKIKGGGSLTK